MRCLCAAWRPLWPECVLQRDFEGFEELEEEAVVHEIVSLGNSMGLEVDDDDVEELVEEHSKELHELHKEENETLKQSLTSEESGRMRTRRKAASFQPKISRMCSFAGANCLSLLRIIILMLVLWKRSSVCLMTM
ncbi:putative Tigger transposable element-derived protein 1-like 318 [Homarus americanus]|uniref:Putative Tigger transposable element-derived protein 1-like 318 n=1 Tax=Homarus americanus TaxID=6706 RepID=A0A8J5KBP3_HOMAM|nr:putative Tigger transposable element-derived protein 1-like 318 [Homarus americanus]